MKSRSSGMRGHRQASIVLCLWPAMLAAVHSGACGQEAGSLNPVAQQALSRLRVTLERPLFTPSRSNPAPPPPMLRAEAPPPQPPPPPPNVTLIGVMKTNEDLCAVLRAGSAETVSRVRIGDAVGGWTVTEIAARHVTLSLDERTTSVSLFRNQDVKPLSEPSSSVRRGAR